MTDTKQNQPLTNDIQESAAVILNESVVYPEETEERDDAEDMDLSGTPETESDAFQSLFNETTDDLINATKSEKDIKTYFKMKMEKLRQSVMSRGRKSSDTSTQLMETVTPDTILEASVMTTELYSGGQSHKPMTGTKRSRSAPEHASCAPLAKVARIETAWTEDQKKSISPIHESMDNTEHDSPELDVATGGLLSSDNVDKITSPLSSPVLQTNQATDDEQGDHHSCDGDKQASAYPTKQYEKNLESPKISKGISKKKILDSKPTIKVKRLKTGHKKPQAGDAPRTATHVISPRPESPRPNSFKMKKSGTRRLTRCSKKDKHLCPVCSQPDCGECKNCQNKLLSKVKGNKRWNKACEKKPLNMCLNYKRLTSGLLDSRNESATPTDVSRPLDSKNDSAAPTDVSRPLDSKNDSPAPTDVSQPLDSKNESAAPTDESKATNSDAQREAQESQKNTTEPRVSVLRQSTLKHFVKKPSEGSHCSQDTPVSEAENVTSDTPHHRSQEVLEDFDSLLDKALMETEVEILTVKCGAFGPPGSGKSHFLAMIQSGKKRPKSRRKSTALAKGAKQILEMDEKLFQMYRTQGESKVNWCVTDNKKITHLVAGALYYGQKQQIFLPSNENQNASKTRKEILKRMKQFIGKKRRRRNLNGMRLIYLVDTGGQPQFQEIMPIFVRNSSMTFLVHKLTESLDDRPSFDYEIGGVKYFVPDEMLVTNREYLKQSLHTISSCTFSRNISCRVRGGIPKPHFAIIGMFKDQCNDQKLAEKNEAVNNCIKPFTESKNCIALTPSRNIDSPVFAIDGSESGWFDNDNVIDDLHISIEKFTDELKMNIPLRWFLFLNLLKEHPDPLIPKEHAKFLSLQQCYEIAKKENIMMDEKDVDEALLLFDELNLILYFPEALHDVVFCLPKFLYNKISEIIVQSFDCLVPQSGLTRQERKEFRETGIFPKCMLEKVKTLAEGFDEATFKIDNLLVLLEKLCIIARVGPDRFLIPCVLALQRREHDSKFLDEMESYMVELGVKPLLITFLEGYSPRGLFCASVAHLAKLPNWIVESPSCQLERKRNLIEFELRELVQSEREVQRAAPLGRVVITDMVSHIQVYSTCEKEHLCDIRQAIYGALCYAANCLSYSLTVNVGFTCTVDCGVSEKHGTAVTFNSKTQRWSSRCVKNSTKRAKPLTAEQEVWFTSDGTNSLTSGPSTSLLELMDEVATQTNEWESIALKLELSQTDIERIKLEEPGRIQNCFRRVFSKWETKGDPPFTWPVIIRALESQSVMEVKLAKELKRRHLLCV